MIFSDRIHARRGAGRAAVAALFLILWLLPVQARACSGVLCDHNIDAFFLPLIASSMTGAPADGAAHPVTATPSTALPHGLVVIKPPRRNAPRPESGLPGWRITVRQHLQTGELLDGGHARLYIQSDPVQLGKQAGDSASSRAWRPALPALLPDQANIGKWHMDHALDIPAHAGWPLGTVRQQLVMRLMCGACGPKTGPQAFLGSAWLELTVDEMAEGWIEDIELASAAGMTASGEISFLDLKPQQHLIKDTQAYMSLKIRDGTGKGDRQGEFNGVLAGWINDDGRISGAFSGVPLDETSGIGGVAAQFSGAPCVPLCGVEN